MDLSAKRVIPVVFSFLAVICHVVGYATNFWWRNTGGTEWVGLWNGCKRFTKTQTPWDNLLGNSRVNPWDHKLVCAGLVFYNELAKNIFGAIRAMETIGLILLIVLLVIGILYLLVERLRSKVLRIILILGSFLAVVPILIGVIIFGAKLFDSTGSGHYSFALVIVGGFLSVLAGIMYVVQPATTSQQPPAHNTNISIATTTTTPPLYFRQELQKI